jgi:hypothetical protein
MKTLHHQIYTALMLLAISLCTACDKMPDNGQLDGMWQLMSIETADGQILNVKEQQHYWSFRLRLVQFTTSRTFDGTKYYAHFSREGGNIVLTDFCLETRYEKDTDDNEWISSEKADLLHPWGVYGQADETLSQKIKATYQVEALSDTRLVLKSDQVRLTLRKF